MYRPTSRPPRGAWSRHLQEQRRVRDLSAVQAFELVYERIGWSPKSRTAYAAIDSGDRQPKGNEVTVLGAEFGWPSAEDERADEVGEQAGIIAAIERQTAMLEKVLTALTAQTIAPERLRALETWMDWMAANPSQRRDGRPSSKQRQGQNP